MDWREEILELLRQSLAIPDGETFARAVIVREREAIRLEVTSIKPPAIGSITRTFLGDMVRSAG